MKIHDLKPAPGSRRPKRRVGRGIGGKGGKTAGRGSKGQGARDTVPVGFEGGQTPLHRRTPKAKGFNNPFRIEYHVVNLTTLETFDANADLLSLLDGLTLLALVGIVDPPRPTAKASIERAHAAGIQVRMITGDHAVTAEAIAQQLGIRGRAITGAEWAAMSDDEAVRHMTGTILTQHGYTVLAARQGAEALRLLSRHAGPLHLVITDLVMPEMSGQTLAHLIAPQRPGLKFLFMSGYAGGATEAPQVTGATTAFLSKPFSPAALATRVRDLLDQIAK